MLGCGYELPQAGLRRVVGGHQRPVQVVALNSEVIGSAFLRLKESGGTVVHQVGASLEHHIHQRRLAFVDEPIYNPPLGYIASVVTDRVQARAE